MEKISGSIKKIIHYSDNNGYTIAIMEVDHRHKNVLIKKGKLYSNTITIIGNFDRKPYENEEYILDGDYFQDPKYGLEFKFTSFQRKEIKNKHGIISYLSSDLFPGIGEKTATHIVDVLGLDAVDLIKESMDVLNQTNLTPKQKQVIYEGIINDHNSQEAIIFFLNNGISIDMTHKIIAEFGETVLSIVKSNPYIIMEKIERFGFKKNDAFALNMGIHKNDIRRLKAVTMYVLQELVFNSGDSYINKADLYQQIVVYLKNELDHDIYEKLLKTLSENKKINIDKDNNVFDYIMYYQENKLAEEITKFLKGTRNPSKKLKTYSQKNIDKSYQDVVNKSSIEFNSEQIIAIRSAFTEPLVIITGGPGTGKTTIVKAIINMYISLHNNQPAVIDDIALLAPTGRAAKRLKETTLIPSMTIHKYLGYQGGSIFTHSKNNPTNSKLVIIDESSMMDTALAYRLFTSLDPDARVIIVGDIDQLPSVGPGQVLKDLIDTKEIKTIRLNKIHRQSENSSIIKLAHSINEGYIPQNILDKLPDRTFIQTTNEALPTLFKNLIIKTIEKGKDISKDAQILIPMYKGDIGINEVNNMVQSIINPYTDELSEVKHFGRILRVNDKVIQLVNRSDKNIMNGDIGYIERITYQNDKFLSLIVKYDTIKVEYNYEELEDINLAYAISVHKAQGSEFDMVIMPITTKHFIMLKRKLIYTAVTRAKKTLLLIGDVSALKMGIRQIEISRKTILKDKIIELLKDSNLETTHIDEIFINDEESAFDTLGEKELGNLTFDDFE